MFYYECLESKNEILTIEPQVFEAELRSNRGRIRYLILYDHCFVGAIKTGQIDLGIGAG